MAVTAVVADWTAEKYAGNTNPGKLNAYMTEPRIKANMSDDFKEDCTFAIGPSATTITYKGVTYTFSVTLTESGNSAKVAYVPEAEAGA